MSEWMISSGVIFTQVLAARVRSQHSITLRSLEKLCGEGLPYAALAAAIDRAAARADRPVD